MTRKIYIFVLTFFCLLCGEMGYAGDVYGGENNNSGNSDNSVCTSEFTDLVESYECYDIYFTEIQEYYCATAIHIGTYWYDTYVFKDCSGAGTIDCNGVQNGTAYETSCGCIGGNTGINECPEEVDCNGDLNGTAYLASCGCIGGYTGIDECPEDETPPGTTEPTCNITSCPTGYVVVDCECALDPCFNKDLRHKKVSDDVKNLIDQRKKTVFMNGSYVDVKLFEIQKIEDGWGDINLDKYALNITNLPNGYTPQMLFGEIRRNFDDFVTGGNLLGTSVGLEPYSTSDGTKWDSSNPIGAAMDFDNFMDTSTVICTEYNYNEMYWTFTTVNSLDHQGHFVSGHRQFGIEANSDGSYSFYLRGADRLGQFVDFATNGFNSGADYLFNEAADATWKNFMSNLEKFIKSKTGAEVKPFDKNKDYAHRFPYNEDDCPE
jgi:hypothetical protein